MVVSGGTTCCNIQYYCIVHIGYILGFCIIQRININYFFNGINPLGICNVDLVSFLIRTDYIFQCYFDYISALKG
jgi:hypothetical protein